MKELIARIEKTPGCRIAPPCGLPVCSGYELPDDMRAFYEACGGLDLYADNAYGIHMVSPAKLVKANPVIRGCQGQGDISFDWFIVAQNSEQHITVDLGKERIGKCYDSFWDRHALRGHTPIIALSFTELLERLVVSRGCYWYWLQDGFRSYGDAYDRA